MTRKERLRQSELIGYTLIAVGVILVGIGLVAFWITTRLSEDTPSGIFSHLIVWLQTTLPAGTPVMVVWLPAALPFGVGFAVIKLGRRYITKAAKPKGQKIRNQPLLYLRPFIADKRPNPYKQPVDWILFPLADKRFWIHGWLVLRGISRFEELLAFAFRRIGTLVTIGNPTERLPLLGAMRLYSSTTEDEWKTVVAQHSQQSRLIILHVGISDSIGWEIEHVVSFADPQRVILCVNLLNQPNFNSNLRELSANAVRRDIQELWAQFRGAYAQTFPKNLPETIGDARFIQFDADWTPIVKPPRTLKLAWFLPGGTLRARTDTVDGVISWLSWLIVPESLTRRVARRFINTVTITPIIGMLLIGLLLSLALLADKLPWVNRTLAGEKNEVHRKLTSRLSRPALSDAPTRSLSRKAHEGNNDIRYDLELSLDEAIQGTVAEVDALNKHHKVTIPAGVDTGTLLRLKGQSIDEPGGIRSSNLWIAIKVRPHPVYTRDGANLYCTMPISSSDLASGTRLMLPPIANQRPLALDVPPGTVDGAHFVLYGHGVPNLLAQNQYGDLYVTVHLK